MMRILIAYDGSKDAEAAIDDLRFCGLPVAGSAQVISVAEVWLPPPGSLEDESETQSSYIEEILQDCRRKGEKAVAESEMLAKFAAGRVRTALPNWDVTSTASYGSPGWGIVTEAENFGADLVLTGAQGHTLLSRLMLGSISQQVLTEAHCSVRIGRGKIDLDSGPSRIIVGFDASRGAHVAVEAVAARNWSEGTEVRLIAVTEPIVPTTIGRFVMPLNAVVNEINVAERTLVEGAAAKALEKLTARGLAASFSVRAGNPKHFLPDEAEKWGADSIFVGANAWGSRLERFLIGSTSAAVAARAHCSVEVVRATLARNHSFADKSSRAEQPRS
jgi:nucleotide-binding universal stress UspA family protein